MNTFSKSHKLRMCPKQAFKDGKPSNALIG